MINHTLYQIKEKENMIIAPSASDFFDYDLTVNELSWLTKKHIFKTLVGSMDLTEYLKIYNQNDDCVPEYDIQNAVLIFKKLNSKIMEYKTQNLELEQRLKKYTNGENHKRYYEKNKEKIKETGASYLQKLKAENPEKIKEYSRQAYQNQKMKKLKKSTIIEDEDNRAL